MKAAVLAKGHEAYQWTHGVAGKFMMGSEGLCICGAALSCCFQVHKTHTDPSILISCRGCTVESGRSAVFQ